MRKFTKWSILLSILSIFGCGNDTSIDEECSVGEERCDCYEDHTCNSGLTCASNLCVNTNGDEEDSLSNELDMEVSDTIRTNQGGGGYDCEGDLAAETFRFALCTCQNANALGILKTGSFDSALDVFDLLNSSTLNPANLSMLSIANLPADDYGAAVGVNRDLSVPGLIEVGGTAILAGPNGVALPGMTTIHGDLKVDGNVQFGGVLEVARDLVVGGVPYEGECVVDEDCCEPLVCDGGHCRELVVII